MITQARRNAIAAELAHRPSMSTQDIATIFACSPATARRDLQALAVAGRIKRSRGGGMALQPPREEALAVDPAADTAGLFVAEKRRIARAAAAMVKDGEAIGIPGGTTMTELARCLQGRRIGG